MEKISKDIMWKRSILLLSSFVFASLCASVAGQPDKVKKLSKTISKWFSSIDINDYLDKNVRMDGDHWAEDEEISKIGGKVKFQFFNEFVPNGFFLNHTKQLESIQFLGDLPTKFVTHGWLSAGMDDVCQTIKDQYLINGNTNVFIVYWDHVSISYLYLFVIQKLKFVADRYAEFLEELIWEKGLDPKRVHLIGHSLGAHLSGMVGKRLRAKNITIGRITGLDPALPGYQQYFDSEKLSSSDAGFVDVIHTCGCALGIMNPIGHVDFYPNGGIHPMPGCDNSGIDQPCSHSRSWQYFAESIVHPFLAVKCGSFASFRIGGCSNDVIEMGNNISTKIRGSFYFSTNDRSPFSLGHNGTVYISFPRMIENANLEAENTLDEIGSFGFGCVGNYVENNKGF